MFDEMIQLDIDIGKLKIIAEYILYICLKTSKFLKFNASVLQKNIHYQNFNMQIGY